MSVTRAHKLRQIFPIESFSWVDDVLTIVTDAPHLLYDGIVVTAHNIDSAYDSVQGAVTVVDPTTFSITGQFTKGSFYQYQVDAFLPGQTGGIGVYPISRSLSYPTVVQSYVNGVGGASYKIQVSLDGEHWIDSENGALAHTTVDEHTAFVTITPGWVYMRPNITSIGVATSLTVIVSG